MKLYNSMNQKIEEFTPIHANKVHMYVCGPTVYNYPHIGNVRPIIVFDLLKRVFEAIGYDVKLVSNYTDVDDKIIKRAKECGVSETEITEKFIKAYNEDRVALHAYMPDASPRVTETMDAIIAFIAVLVQQGNAYAVDGDVYFRVNSAKDYGQLSNQQMEDLLVGARIDENNKKENPLDFTLWKKTEEGIRWDSPWSKGRPGWHTECVVMIQQAFHEHRIDIHGGGLDLKFPHHENEIAQSRVAYGTPIANYWMHNGMVNIEGEKMSKSLGNVIWAKDLITQISGRVLRWLMLSTHYRSPLNISEEAIETAKKEVNKVLMSMKQAYVLLSLQDKAIIGKCDDTLLAPFLDALCHDLNTPNACKALYEAIKIMNQTLRQRAVDTEKVTMLLLTVENMLDILGIEYARVCLHEEDRVLYRKWQQAVKEKDFVQGDTYRKTLMERGIL